MTMGELDWVGAAPLDASAMARLRKDLILQRTVLWIPTGLIVALMMLFLFGLPLGAREAIAVLAFATFLGLVLGRLAGDSRYRQIRIALLRGMDIAPLLEQEGRGITARFLGLPGGTDVLDIVMRPKEGGKLAKEKDPWQGGLPDAGCRPERTGSRLGCGYDRCTHATNRWHDTAA
ncbi:MAG TPA: hypothetical protein EYQ80_02470 [Candidatus Poseidoniales archaeon]|nr:hypothetical protein [Candidatus Poseidoniales archaeon]